MIIGAVMELLKPLSKTDFPAYSVAYTGTAGNTSTWNAGPQGVVVWSDQPCYVEVGEGAVATTASTPIPAYTPIPFAVPITVSGVWRVSAIQVSTGGTVYCKPINKQ
jgi:hypothetical protein